MRIIIVGCGKVGRTLADQLQEENTDLTLIDIMPEKLNAITEDVDAMGIVGNGASINTLREAGIETADILIAVTASDELNLLCCLIAQKSGHCHTIARVRNPIYNKEIGFLKERLGVTLEVKILTNGTQLSSERISAISKYISSVQISIDGFSEKSNSLVRGKGNFAKALAAVDTFISNGVYTSIAITPSLDSLRKYMDKYIEFALVLTQKYENNAFELRFSEELLNGRSISNAENINSEYKELMSKVQKELYGSDYKLWEFVKTLTDNPKITNCSFGNICVNSIGDVFLCPRISDLKSIGNIRTKEFKDINHEADIAESLTSIINLIPCNTCDLRYICGGGCRIEEYPGLTYRETFVGLNPNEYPRQECNNNQKKIFYDLMIESNEYFYSDLNEE